MKKRRNILLLTPDVWNIFRRRGGSLLWRGDGAGEVWPDRPPHRQPGQERLQQVRKYFEEIKNIKYFDCSGTAGPVVSLLPCSTTTPPRCRPTPRPATRSFPSERARYCSHWSSSYITALSLVQSDATPALLCHKEPAQGTKAPY